MFNFTITVKRTVHMNNINQKIEQLNEEFQNYTLKGHRWLKYKLTNYIKK